MKFRDLKANDIDIRVGQIGDGYFTLLLYKDARVDMDILDETVGAEKWQREHYEVKGNLFCRVGIFTDDLGWAWKSDCGTESNTEKEKGESSDSFKRACINWGIGRELYTAPKIFINGNCKKGDKKLTYKDFEVESIEIKDKIITKLEISAYNNESKKRETVYPKTKKTETPKETSKKSEILEKKTNGRVLEILNCELDNQSKLVYLIKEKFIPQEKALKALNGEKANDIPKETFVKLIKDLTNEN